MRDLPHKLRIEISLYLHEETYRKILFLHDKSLSFIAWICPLLKPYLLTDNEYVYFEGDEVSYIYFLREGNCYYQLPKYNNARYLRINEGNYFGFSDIIGSIIKNDDIDQDDWISRKDLIVRQSTIASDIKSEALLLRIEDVNRLQNEFLESYEKMIQEAYIELEASLKFKLLAIKQCQDQQK